MVRFIQDDSEALIGRQTEGKGEQLQRAGQVITAAVNNLATAIASGTQYKPLYIEPDPELQRAIAEVDKGQLSIIGAFVGDANENFQSKQMEIGQDGLIKRFKFRFSNRGPRSFQDYEINEGSLFKPSVARGPMFTDPVSEKNEIVPVAAYLQQRLDREIFVPGKRVKLLLQKSDTSSYFGPKWYVKLEDTEGSRGVESAVRGLLDK